MHHVASHVHAHLVLMVEYPSVRGTSVRARAGLGSILFRTPFIGLQVLACLAPLPPPRNPRFHPTRVHPTPLFIYPCAAELKSSWHTDCLTLAP